MPVTPAGAGADLESLTVDGQNSKKLLHSVLRKSISNMSFNEVLKLKNWFKLIWELSSFNQ